VFGICRCTVSGKFLDVNPALIAMLGHGSVEDMLQLDAGAKSSLNLGSWTGWRTNTGATEL